MPDRRDPRSKGPKSNPPSPEFEGVTCFSRLTGSTLAPGRSCSAKILQSASRSAWEHSAASFGSSKKSSSQAMARPGRAPEAAAKASEPLHRHSLSNCLRGVLGHVALQSFSAALRTSFKAHALFTWSTPHGYTQSPPHLRRGPAPHSLGFIGSSPKTCMSEACGRCEAHLGRETSSLSGFHAVFVPFSVIFTDFSRIFKAFQGISKAPSWVRALSIVPGTCRCPWPLPPTTRAPLESSRWASCCPCLVSKPLYEIESDPN